MNSSVQTQWCNFRLPTPFPNKTAAIWFLLERWFYGVIYSIRSALEGAARAQPSAAVPRGGTFLLFSLLFHSKPHLEPNTQTATQPLRYYFASPTMMGVPPLWWCPAIFSIYKFNPSVFITRNHRIRRQLVKVKDVWTFPTFPTPEFLQVCGVFINLYIYRLNTLNIHYIFIVSNRSNIMNI